MSSSVRLEHAYCAAGELPARRTKIPIAPEDIAVDELEAWYVDAGRAAVAALWTGGVLWLGGAAVRAIDAGGAVDIGEIAGGPYDGAGRVTRWARVTPTPGVRYVVTSADIWVDAAGSLTREALARRLVERSPAAGGAALVLDAAACEPPRDFLAWIASLQRDGVDLSWTGNESGPGLSHTFRRRASGDVRLALREQARADEVIAGRIAEYVQTCLEDQTGAATGFRLLVDGAPERGFVCEVSRAELASGIRGGAGAWLDPGTARARRARTRCIPGASLVATMQQYVDGLAAIGVASQPDPEAVLMFHVVGGVDRDSGDLVGFVLERVWT